MSNMTTYLAAPKPTESAISPSLPLSPNTIDGVIRSGDGRSAQSNPTCANTTGSVMHQWMADLYPICRSITGDGVRQTLRYLQQIIPLAMHEVPSGTPVLDWVVPQEWNIRSAYLKDPQGNIVVDFQDSSLHVLNYSTPIHQSIPLKDLKPHLFSLPEHPDWIPYRTSYYRENWGFCLPHAQLQTLPDGDYDVMIDATLAPGCLTYGEYVILGESSQEVLLSCHCCHPSLANDNLSGMALATFLAHTLTQASDVRPLRYTYRFLFVPGTIGSITWLSLNRGRVNQIQHGLVIAGVGDRGPLHYKKSRQGDAEIDRVVAYVLAQSGQEFAIADFSPYGYDERQYCSPGFNLPVGSLTRTPFERYPQYHTSADNLDFVCPEALAASLQMYLRVIYVLEHNRTYRNLSPYGEPQLGKRGLYGMVGGKKTSKAEEMALLWVLNLSDGNTPLLDIATRSQLDFALLQTAADRLLESGLLQIAH
jgi:aminopeptidase-like protein